MAKLNIKKIDDKLNITIERHENETEDSLTYRHALYLLQQSIELNFMNVTDYPYSTDVGASIVVLDKDLIDSSTYLLEDSTLNLNLLNLNSSDYNHLSTSYESNQFTKLNYLEESKENVLIRLDLSESSKYIGGFNTPSAIAARALFEYYRSEKECVLEPSDDSFLDTY